MEEAKAGESRSGSKMAADYAVSPSIPEDYGDEEWGESEEGEREEEESDEDWFLQDPHGELQFYREARERTEPNQTTWQQIHAEADDCRRLYEQCKRFEEEEELKPKPGTDVEYLDENIFPFLSPALKRMLLEAVEWKCLKVQKCIFNGVDFLAEFLWNTNPRHEERATNWTTLWNIPPFKEWLKEHPRPIYPLSWLLTEEEAASIIQSYYRGYLVRRRKEIHRMRSFWKAVQKEKAERKHEANAEEAKRLVREEILKGIFEKEEASKDKEETIRQMLEELGEEIWQKICENEKMKEGSEEEVFTEPYMAAMYKEPYYEEVAPVDDTDDDDDDDDYDEEEGEEEEEEEEEKEDNEDKDADKKQKKKGK